MSRADARMGQDAHTGQPDARQAPAEGHGVPGLPEVALGRLRWWDLEEVLAVEAEVFADQAWTPTQFWSELARPQSRWYVLARAGRRVAGYAGLFVVGPEADVQTVAVARDMQGRGVGGRLLDALLDRAREVGVRVVHLEVAADNHVASGLYAGRGFVVDGRRRDYYGPGRDAVLMSRRLLGADDGR
jgi:ribosomal-protein-alanine N-acetyltransferase